MKEIHGELWDYFGKPDCIVCITTNGFVKKNGEAVMGAGNAKQAKERMPWLPGVFGTVLKELGNVVHLFGTPGEEEMIVVFPVKHNWWERADTELIKKSAERLKLYATRWFKEYTFILPRPGCGNGGLRWEDVRPLLEGLPDNVHVISPVVQ